MSFGRSVFRTQTCAKDLQSALVLHLHLHVFSNSFDNKIAIADYFAGSTNTVSKPNIFITVLKLVESRIEGRRSTPRTSPLPLSGIFIS
jgi:hypothetical protein